MLQQSDVEGRLRLFRYGLLVLVVVAFGLSLGTQYLGYSGAADAPSLVNMVLTAALYTVVAGVVGVVVYFGYKSMISRAS